MKIALLSFHNALNYGAALQAYALQYAIESMGEKAEYIDYVNETREAAYNMMKRARSALKKGDYIRASLNFLGAPLMELRRRNFIPFYENRLNTTSRIYSSSAEASELNDEYDAFIVGSDQVWNPENTGSDSAFLLDFVKDKKRISYSSSFGITDVPEKLKNVYSSNLSKFEAIAVRESAGVDIVNKLTGRKAALVLDPVFLVSHEKWRSIEKRNNDESYIFYYLSSKSQIDTFELNSGLQQYKRHILASSVSPIDFFNSNNKMVISCSPEEFLGEIDCGTYIVTDSFHCTALSIIFHKNFWVYLSGDHGKDERILNILDITGLRDRIITPNLSPYDIQEEIDYSQVDEKLSTYISQSMSYLHAALYGGDINNTGLERLTNSKYFCTDYRCTGCMACLQSCPQDAIIRVSSSDGFYVPKRIEKKCIDCGRCHNICPVFSEQRLSTEQQEYWAFIGKKEIVSKSTSGGIFTYLSDKVIESDGVVIAPKIDGDFHLIYGIANNKDQRDSMRGTYYVQCEVEDSYEQVKELLNTGRKVLFVGTPCYCAGLRSYLQKDYLNLIVCDLVCHGSGSPIIFEAFINSLKARGNLSSYKCRDKDIGWRGYTNSCVIDGHKYKDNTWVQSYDNMFSHNLINRSSCGICPFTNLDRVGDITIGDFWGNSNKITRRDRKQGISLVICNTEKGKNLFHTIEEGNGERIISMQKSEVFQNSLLHPAKASFHRTEAIWTYNNKGYLILAQKFGGQNLKGSLMMLARKILLR